MRHTSTKRRHRQDEAAPVREELIARVGRCEFCGDDKSALCVHEVLRGSHRQKALDQLYAVLCLCWPCHELMGGRPLAEQLAILRRSRREDYDLQAFHALAGRNYPDEADVRMWLKRITLAA